ncbi:MAG: hypothetical protein M0R06_01125 [Sphaerochaeta sp.]|nr:hypothetical protein [Sphaerochaeta sp.]
MKKQITKQALYVGHLSRDATVQEIIELFAQIPDNCHLVNVEVRGDYRFFTFDRKEE